MASAWKRAYGGGDTAATVKDPGTAAAMDRLGNMEWLFALGNHDYRYFSEILLLLNSVDPTPAPTVSNALQYSTRAHTRCIVTLLD